jgi:phosphoglycerate kinase
VLHETKRPFTAIIGGSKVSSKLNIIKNLVTKVDNLIIAGGMSYTFLAALDVKIGNSLFEPEMVRDAKTIIKQAHRLGVDLYIPIDNVCGDSFSNDANVFVTTYNDIPDGWEGLDIGPKTIKKFSTYITHSSTILWNGPVGVFEFDKFGKGTHSIALAVAANTLTGAFSLLGGGDSISAVNQYGLGEYISYISTGGGAMLEYLEGVELPGIKALHDNE